MNHLACQAVAHLEANRAGEPVVQVLGGANIELIGGFIQQQKRPFWTRTRKLILIAVAAVCVMGVVFGEFGFLRILLLKRESGELQAQIVEAKMRQRILEEEKDRLENDEFTVEKKAREECGLYKKGEKVFVFEADSASGEYDGNPLDK